MWTVVNFGKWRDKGLTLPQIVLRDPDWFFWAIAEDAFPKPLQDEAKLIAYRATHIKLNKPNPNDWEVEYLIGVDGKFGDFEVVPTDRPLHQGSSTAFRGKHLSLSVPRRIKGYDKLGCRLMLKNFKYYWFGKIDARLTKERCEAFFDDLSNFV